MLTESGWTLKTIIYSGGEAHNTHDGTWLAIRNEKSTTGYVLRISNLGLMTYEYTDKHLGLGVNQHGSIRPMKGNADGKFLGAGKTVSESTLFGKSYVLYMSTKLEWLKLFENGIKVIAMTENGLYRYTGCYGYAAHDNDGRIQIMRTGFNAAH